MAKWRRGKRVELRSFATALMGAPDAPLWVVPAWFLGGAIVNVFSPFLGLHGLAYIAVPIIASYVIWRWWRGRKLVPVPLESVPPGKQGLILPLSTIAIFSGSEEDRRALPEALVRLRGNAPTDPTDGDFDLLQRTNLESPFRAIEYHYRKNTLRDCWLITTQDLKYEDGTVEHGSSSSAEILDRWFFKFYPDANGKVTLHRDESLCVHPRDYAGMWLLVDSLFEGAPYKAENVIVDITPGTKPMTLAIALACLKPKRTMQYIVTGRHPLTGEVLEHGRRVPVLIDVDPYLYDEDAAIA